MIVNTDSAIIKYSRQGIDFHYLKLFIQTTEKYILEYKNVEYDKLTDKDKSVALARIIKSMEVNGKPVTVFFADVLKKWEDKENFEKNQLFVDFMAQEIFGCYDRNRDRHGEFYETPYLFYIIKDGKRDYFEPPKPSKALGIFRSGSSDEAKLHEYFEKLKRQEARGTLPTYMCRT